MTADARVRPAHARDAPAIGRIQVRAWTENHAAALGRSAGALDLAAIVSAWAQAISRPPNPEHRVLSACSGNTVVGFAALAPLAEPDQSTGETPAAARVEIVTLEIEPTQTGLGHGSRLLAACVDLARASAAAAVSCWVLEDDGARASFLRSAGFAPDGARRTLDVDGRAVREDRWAAAL